MFRVISWIKNAPDECPDFLNLRGQDLLFLLSVPEVPNDISSQSGSYLQFDDSPNSRIFTVTPMLVARRTGAVALSVGILTAGILCRIFVPATCDINSSVPYANGTL